MFHEELIAQWASDWQKLLDNRRSLFYWKESLKADQENYNRTKVTDYLDDIEEDQYAIHELEGKIADMKGRINTKSYDPYDILQIAPSATGEQIYQAYLRHYNDAETFCSVWAANLKYARTPMEKIVCSNSLEEARFMLRQVVRAYKKLRSSKPYNPDKYELH